MITLNSERGFVKVESWDDIEELNGFTDDLNPTEHELKEIIGRYIFKDYIKCGLSNCHTPHGKGYIVSTKSGKVTNIGHNCGKTHFNIDFDQMSRSFERSIEEHNCRETIGSFLIVSDLYKEQVKEIRSGPTGADELYKKGQMLTKGTSGCPQSIIAAIGKMVRSRNPEIEKDRLASDVEVEEIEAIENRTIKRPYYISEKVAELQGLSFMYSENDIRNIVVFDLEDGFKCIEALDVDHGAFKELKKWSRWCADFEQKLESLQNIVSAGRLFLAKENLSKLSHYCRSSKDIEDFDRFLKAIV